jgi:hypothetical protein
MTSEKNWRSISGSTERLNDGGVDGVIGSHKWQGKKTISTGWRQEGGGRGKAKGNQLLNDSYEEISLKKKKMMEEGWKNEK